MWFKFFKKSKKEMLINLEQAKSSGLITQEEFLELSIKRLERELKELQEGKKKKK